MRACFLAVIASALVIGGGLPLRAASTPAKPAAAAGPSTPLLGIVPYGSWVVTLSAKKDVYDAEQARLVFYAGRLGEWDTVQSFLRLDKISGPQRAALYLSAARAARFNKDWTRGKEMLGKLRDAIASMPKTDRSFDLLSGFCIEAAALRQAEGINERFEEAANKMEEVDTPPERFARLRALALVTVYAHDEKTFSEIGGAIVQFARQWTEAEPGFGAVPAKGDVAIKEFVGDLNAAGEYGVAAQIARGGIGDEGILAEAMFRAQSAGLASAPAEKIEEQVNLLSSHQERLGVTLGTVEDSGLVFYLARNNRPDVALRLLVRARDLGFTPAKYDPNDGVARTRDQLPAIAFLRQKWSKSILSAAREYVRAGLPAQAAALGALYTDARNVQPPAQKSDLPDLLADQVAFAAYLAEAGQVAEARRLLDALPADYVTAGAANSEYARMDLAIARALLGDFTTAQSIADTLKNGALRVQAFSAVVVAAQGKNDVSRSTTAFGLAAKAYADSNTHVSSPEGLAAYMTALAVTGSSASAWKILSDTSPAQAKTVLSLALTRVIAGGHWMEAAGWISTAPDEWKPEAWHTYFQLGVPDPSMTPFAPGEMVAPNAPAATTPAPVTPAKP